MMNLCIRHNLKYMDSCPMCEKESKGIEHLKDYPSSSYSVVLSNGKTFPNAIKLGSKEYDFLKSRGSKLTDAMTDVDNKELKEASQFVEKLKEEYKRSNLGQNVYDFSNRDATLRFCQIAPNIPQFAARVDFFKRFHNMISEAHIYRFREELIKIIVEKNRNIVGYRHMPFNNMFLEVFMECGKVAINGIHIVRVAVDPVNEEQIYMTGENVSKPAHCTEDGICVFYTGIDGNNVAFFDYFTLDRNQTKKYESKKEKARYSCPRCHAPLTDLTSTEVICENSPCNELAKDLGFNVIYDLKDKKVKRLFRTQRMTDIWKSEKDVRLFVSNFLDFYTNRDVIVRPLMTEDERAERNAKRAQRGKSYIPPIKVINVKGHIYKYIESIKQRFHGDIELIKHQTWVEGTRRRFMKHEKFHKLYGLIKDCKTDDAKMEALSNFIRRDKDGLPLSKEQQYEWNPTYEVITEWILPFIKNKDGVIDDRMTVKVVGK